MDIASRLKKLRTAKGYSVYKLSQESGVSETHIRDLERGDRNPSLDTIDRIAKTFGITLSELLNEDETVSYVTVRIIYPIDKPSFTPYNKHS